MPILGPQGLEDADEHTKHSFCQRTALLSLTTSLVVGIQVVSIRPPSLHFDVLLTRALQLRLLLLVQPLHLTFRWLAVSLLLGRANQSPTKAPTYMGMAECRTMTAPPRG